ELPLAQRVGDASLKTPFLFLVVHFEPVFDELDAAVNHVTFEFGADLKEATVLFLGAEAHHEFNSGPIVPAAIENDDLSRRREVLHVSLHVHLGLFTIRRGGQRDQPEDARTDTLGDGPDGATLAGAIAPLKYDHHAQALVFDPILQFAKLGLEPTQFL